MSRDLRLFLEDIATACRRIIRYCGGLTFAEFRQDEKTFDAVVRNLEVIGEAAKRVPVEDRELHPEVAWRKIAGLRDVIAHGYFSLEPEMLWDVVSNRVPELLPQILDILAESEEGA